MYNLNRAMIIGNLTRDPDMRYTANGQPVTSFSIATNRSWTDAEGNRQDQVEYHDFVAWGKLAEIASQVLHKGQPAFVEGRLQTRSWEAQDGTKRQKTEITAENIIALQGRSGGGAGGDSQTGSSTSAPRGQLRDGAATFMPKGPTADDMLAGGKPSAPASAPKKDEITIEDLDDIPF